MNAPAPAPTAPADTLLQSDDHLLSDALCDLERQSVLFAINHIIGHIDALRLTVANGRRALAVQAGTSAIDGALRGLRAIRMQGEALLATPPSSADLPHILQALATAIAAEMQSLVRSTEPQPSAALRSTPTSPAKRPMH